MTMTPIDNKTPWYSTSFRRHLCDMHIEEWDDTFLSQFSPEDYHRNLVRARIQNAMIYFQSHVGTCYFPTASGRMHKAFEGREETMRRLVTLCRDSGITVTGYYSLIHNNWAHDLHPEWRMILGDGRSMREMSHEETMENRYGLCCPNNAAYRAFVFEQLAEMNGYFEFDAMFFDMPFWPHMCYCSDCKARYLRETGKELPHVRFELTEERRLSKARHSVDWNDPEWLLHVHKRREWMGEFTQTVTAEMKRLRPGVPCEHNLQWTVWPIWNPCCCEEVNEACDYAGGDIYGGFFHHSFTCKFFRNFTRNQPFEYMFTRCNPDLHNHTVTKTDDLMAVSTFLTAAHHGATLIIDAIDPVGTLDGRVYDRIGAIFGKAAAYEPHFTGRMVEDVGVYYSQRSKFELNGNPYNNHYCAVNTVGTMIEHNVSVGVTGGWHPLEPYRFLFASCLTREDEHDNERIISYVRNGGLLYLSGGDNPELLRELTGGSVDSVTESNVVYISPTENYRGILGEFNRKYPLPFKGRVPVVTGIDPRDVIATLAFPYTVPSHRKFASIHSNPPGPVTDIPAMIMRSYGKGRVIWSAAPLEYETVVDYRKIILNLLHELLPEKNLSLRSNAPRNVEIVLFENPGEDILVHVVHLSEEAEIPRVGGFEIRIKSGAKPREVLLLPDLHPVEFTHDEGEVRFTTRELHIFDMYRIVL